MIDLNNLLEIRFCVYQCQQKNKQTRKDPKFKKLIAEIDDLYNKEFAKFYINADKYFHNGKECVITKHEKNYCHIITLNKNGFDFLNTSNASKCVMYSELTKQELEK